ncbi:sulfite oxidase isoform X1 [Tachypleus tridentatus]|uniref:sulfite oxidase isoform X1 n=1 Tax=Tachypleus tridentatus TaxID=6853 RepID=UPI003FD0F825
MATLAEITAWRCVERMNKLAGVFSRTKHSCTSFPSVIWGHPKWLGQESVEGCSSWLDKRNFHDFNTNAHRRKKESILACVGVVGVGVATALAFYYKSYVAEAKKDAVDVPAIQGHTRIVSFSSSLSELSESKTGAVTAGEEIVGLPEYTMEEVTKHDCLQNRIWVSYHSGVYDITDFIPKHPGGTKILMAAGGSLEPFWEMYAVHKKDEILAMMEEYRIGNLRVEDRGYTTANMADPYAAEPKRHHILQPRSVKPFNAEPPLSLLVDSFITPNELFFIRNHLPVPEIIPEEYELEISGIGIKKEVVLTLEELKTKFLKHTITTTIQCAGNRRSEINKIKKVKGLDWGSAAISTAEWSGARLLDVLKYAGADLNHKDIKHVEFEGLDTDPAHQSYGASVPAEKALNPNADILLAYEMNGNEIPRDHGYPVRAIVPGVVGARNVKWVGRVVLADDESHSHWQRRDYKGFSSSCDWDTADFDKAYSIQELPVQSAICIPLDGATVSTVNGAIKTKGYAWSGGGRKIIRVDVSVDQGETWISANLNQDDSSIYQSWAWTLWEADIPLPENARPGTQVELICKAVDSSYNVQPETFEPLWNIRGVLATAWHRVTVTIE